MKSIPSDRPPRHIAIIMDGNGRWARQRGLPRLEGHRAGAEAVRRVVTAAAELGIGYLTLYAFSIENWKRPKTEVRGLMGYLRGYLRRELPTMQKNNVRFLAFGRLEELPVSVRKALDETTRDTTANTGLTLILAVNYGSRLEITDAARSAISDALAGKLHPRDLTPESFSRYLYTRDIPDPDLLIRTSGELRLSNFLLWQSSYSELYFPEVHWPDFDRGHLEEAIREYARRERRYGGVKPC